MIPDDPSFLSCGTDRNPATWRPVDMQRADRRDGAAITRECARFALGGASSIGQPTQCSRRGLLLRESAGMSALQLSPAALALSHGADCSHAGDEHRARDAGNQSADAADPGARLPRGNGRHVRAFEEAGEPILRGKSTDRAVAGLGYAALNAEATRTLPSSFNSIRI